MVPGSSSLVRPMAGREQIQDEGLRTRDGRRTKHVGRRTGPYTKTKTAFRRRGITVVPDILANAGGVTVSYFERSQNIQQFRWDLERVNDGLDRTMRRAYAAVRSVARERNVDSRTAATTSG